VSPDAQRIAIAEACGWSVVNHGVSWDGVLRYEQDGMAAQAGNVPDYLNDLNAMHEAEKLFTTTDQQNGYYENIAEITWGCEETGNRQVVFNQLTATAAQRAEAFLKTLSLWTP
jgi:hypothetical protein